MVSNQSKTFNQVRCRRWGHSQRFDRLPVTSGLLRTTDSIGGGRHVSNVRERDLSMILRWVSQKRML